MPITVQLPEGLFSSKDEEELVVGLTEAILEINGASNNQFARKHLIVAVTTIPQERLYANGERTLWANVTLRIPPFSLQKYDQQKAFVERMTVLFDQISGGKVPADRLYINLIWGDGFWGIGGQTWSNFELLQEVLEAADDQAAPSR